jgi:hypothetical protein
MVPQTWRRRPASAASSSKMESCQESGRAGGIRTSCVSGGGADVFQHGIGGEVAVHASGRKSAWFVANQPRQSGATSPAADNASKAPGQIFKDTTE